MAVGGGVWDLLTPYARPERPDFLRVAIDLSYWIVQQETAIKSYSLKRIPHFRLPLFRTINLFSKEVSKILERQQIEGFIRIPNIQTMLFAFNQKNSLEVYYFLWRYREVAEVAELVCEGSALVDRSENDAQSSTTGSVLVVDCDNKYLTIVSDMLHRFKYKVITAKRAAHALCIVRETENELDLILTETHLPDMERYEFLEALGQMSNLPIVVMSVENDSKAILGSYHKGAVFYLVKPFMMNDVKNLWQFAYISKTERMMSMEGLSGFTGELRHGDSEAQESVETMEKQVLLCDKGNEQEDMDNAGEEDNLQVLKELRITWTDDLHEKFLQAVKELGIQNARPRSILEHMNVQGLTRDKISSHLQKYRLALRKELESAQNTARKSFAESMNTAHQPEFQSYFQENLNSPMDMPSLGSIYPTNHVDTGPNGVLNFMHGQSTLQNSFPDFSGPDSSQFAFEDFDMGEFPHSNRMKNHVFEVLEGTITLSNEEDSGFSVTYHPNLFDDTLCGQQEEQVNFYSL